MNQHAEYVSPGHPDRLADAIAESIVTVAVRQKPDALVGVEVAVHTDRVFVYGRIAAGSQPVISRRLSATSTVLPTTVAHENRSPRSSM
jgi:S-adenosylmethionine synthetase